MEDLRHIAISLRPILNKMKDLNKDNMKRSQGKGLYQEVYEHDACGVGMVVNIHGGKSHELVDNALKVLENMEHRGAETRDKTGDGAGIMVLYPMSLFCCRVSPFRRKDDMGRDWCSCPRLSRRSSRY